MISSAQSWSADWWSAAAAWVGLVLSTVLAIAKGVESWKRRRVRAALKVVMTQDGFVRYAMAGELVFLNIVYMGARRPSLISDVEASMIQYGDRDDIINRVPLKLLRVGVPRDRGNPIHDHFFFSSSPLDLISPGTPERRVMMFVVESGQSDIGSAMSRFDVAARGIMSSDVGVDKMRAEVDRAGEALGRAVKESAEILNGRYQVVMKVHYSDAEHESEVMSASASMRLEVGTNGGHDLQVKIAEFGRHFAASIVDPNVTAVFPEASFERVVVDPRISK